MRDTRKNIIGTNQGGRRKIDKNGLIFGGGTSGVVSDAGSPNAMHFEI
jgi:hypothetical protein